MPFKKILYLSYDGMTDHLGQSQVIPYMQGLAKMGNQITIVSFEKKIQFQSYGNNILQLLKNSNIVWKPLIYTKKPPVLSTVWDILRLLIYTTFLSRKYKYDIVHCRSYITTFAGEYLKHWFSVKFIFDMRGFWADERVEGNLWDVKKPIYKYVYKYFKTKEIQWLKGCDHIISLTENAKNYMITYFGVDSSKITVIPCCVDIDLFNPQNINQEIKKSIKYEFEIAPNQMILGYLGSVGTWYMLPEMLLFFKLFLQKYSNSLFVIYTAEPPENIFKAAQKAEILPENIRVKNIERIKLPQYISIFDISLCFVKPSFSKKASSPTKLGELMAMGIPVISNKGVGDCEMILNKYQSGLLIDDMCSEQLKLAIDCVENILTIEKSKIRYAAIDFFSLSSGIAKYADVYSK